VRLERLFHLFGEDFLAAAVDAGRAAAQQGDRAIRFHRRKVAGDRIADAVERPEGLCALGLVLVIAERYHPAIADQSHFARAGGHGFAFFGQHPGGRVHIELGSLVGIDIFRSGDRNAHAAFGRTHAVDNCHMGQVGEQPALDLGRPHHARRSHHRQRRQIIGLSCRPGIIQRGQHRLGKDIADNRDIGDLLVLGQLPERGGVEMAVVEQDHAAAQAVRDHRTDPHAGAVHQGAGGDGAGHRPGLMQLPDQRAEVGGIRRRLHHPHLETLGEQGAGKALVIIHDALGHAGGATGIEHVKIVVGPGDHRHWLRVLQRLFVRDRAVEMFARAIVDLEEELDLLELVADRRDARRELRLEDQRLAVAVVDHMGQLRLEIAVVDVDWADSRLEGPELGFEIFGSIMRIDRQLCARLQAMVGQHPGNTGGAILIFGPAAALVAVHNRGLVGYRRGNIFPDIGHLPGHAILSLFFPKE